MLAARITEHITGTWRAAPPVSVVRSPADLPVPAPEDARGLFWAGRAWIVTGTQSPVDVAGTLAHEVVGHHGLRQLLGRAWPAFMGAVRRGAGADPTLRDLQQGIRDVYGVLPGVLEGDEIAAHTAEGLAHPLTGRLAGGSALRKMARAAAGLFWREGLLLDQPADADELHGALLLSEHVVRHGRLPLVPWWRVRYIPSMSKPSTHKPYSTIEDQEQALRELRDRKLAWGTFKDSIILLICLGFVIAGIYQFLSWLSR